MTGNDEDDKSTSRPAGDPLEIVFGPLAEMLGYYLRRAQLEVFQDFHETLAEHEVRPAEFSVLLLLRENPGVRQSRLADALGIKRANFVPLFDRLEARGWAQRHPVAQDRRAMALALTSSGAEKLACLLPLVKKHEARFDDRLGDGGKRQLLLLLQQLTMGQ